MQITCRNVDSYYWGENPRGLLVIGQKYDLIAYRIYPNRGILYGLRGFKEVFNNNNFEEPFKQVELYFKDLQVKA